MSIILIAQPLPLCIINDAEGSGGKRGFRIKMLNRRQSRRSQNFILTPASVLYLLPVKAIQRAYLVASLRQCDATRSPQVTVSEMMPMMMKNSVVTHSGGSRGGMQVRSRPWMV